jgi:hypothetical protein
VLALIVLSTCFVGYAVYASLPRQRRGRAVARLATSVGAQFQRRFRAPSTMHQLPFLALVPVDHRQLFGGFEGGLNDRRIAVFARSQAPDEYEPTIWRSCAAASSVRTIPRPRNRGLCISAAFPGYAGGAREWRNLADALDLGSSARKGVGVQISPLAHSSPRWSVACPRGPVLSPSSVAGSTGYPCAKCASSFSVPSRS